MRTTVRLPPGLMTQVKRLAISALLDRMDGIE
jgi:hypothetical protein